MMNPNMAGTDDDIIEELADAAGMIVNDCAQNSPTPANRRYKKAYGNYQGGYGPGGGYGGTLWGRGNLRPPPPPNYEPGPMDFGPGPMNFGPGPGRNFNDYEGFDDFDYDGGPPRGPPQFALGRGYGPFGPRGPPPPQKKNELNKKVNKYLIRCGMAKNDLKNLPDEFYKKIEPECCHICAIEFDTFSMSRMHYASKNHLKKQKRWLTHYDESPRFGGKKNIPMKSRDLYCELCDVEITSKTHAESHYAGKPHRAIVEGRRNPKNPILLERGMESRLKQLVNREKKFLKKGAEAAPEEQPTETPQETKPAKPVPPELFCETCNTSVTCTEQMAMHRNGKRHLAKEKNFIMRYMKGEAIPNSGKKGNYSEGNGAEEGGNEGNTMQTEDNGNGNQASGNAEEDDWGTVDGSTAAEW